MKKCKWIVLLITIALTLLMNGCDWKSPFTAKKPKTKKEQVAEKFANMTPPPIRTPNVTETPMPESTATPVPTMTPIPTPTPTPKPINWAEEYGDFWERAHVIPENYQLDTTLVIEGVKADIVFAQTKTADMLGALIGNTKINLFQVDEKIYMQKLDKSGEEWYWAPISYEGELTDIFGIDLSTDFTETEKMIIGSVYGGEVQEEETIYDVLNVTTSYNFGSMQVAVYVDREQQNIYKLQTKYMEQDIVAYLKERDEIILPAKSKIAKELTMDEFSKKVKKVVMLSAASAIFHQSNNTP